MEEIIIDGVDVSGCRYLFDDTTYKHSKTSCSITLKDCKYLGNNCYYKQLKRLEQENARLKEKIKKYAAINEQETKDYAELKAENFELKESLKCFQTPEAIKALTFYKTGEFELQEKKCIELEQENARLKEEIEIRDNLSEKFRKEALSWANIANECQKDKTKLKQTLQEIKAIVCSNYEIIDPQGRKDILKLITKAEEE